MQTIGIWRLREEARKSWDHVVSDEIVYSVEAVARNLQLPHTFAEKYIDGSGWFEMHFTTQEEGQGEMHFNAILEVADVGFPHFKGRRKADPEIVAIHRNSPVLIHRPEFIQLPKGIVPVGIPSEVRLKSVEDLCHCGWKKAAPELVGAVIVLEDQKTDIPLVLFREMPVAVKVSESPSQLLQGGSQATQEIAEQDGNKFAIHAEFDAKEVQCLIEICVFADGESFRVLKPHFHFRLKGIEVKLCPTGFHFKLGENIPARDRRHDPGSLAGCGTIGA
jgi:hypothetical protein